MLSPPVAPRRTYLTELVDSTRWARFQPRAGDIVVTTPPKSGTTWTQGILAMLIAGDPDVDADTAMKSPWIDMCRRPLDEVMARLDAQTQRRHVKSHTPFDGLPVWPDLRYLTVYRHPIDVHFSFRKHAKNQKNGMFDALFPDDVREGFRLFLDGENPVGANLAGILHHYRCTLDREPADNLLRLHYADMLRDLPGAVARIAAHLGISHPPDLMAAIARGATLESMRGAAHRFVPSAGQDFWHDEAAFFDSATSNKWEGVLTDDDLAAYAARVDAVLSPPERRWLERGTAA